MTQENGAQDSTTQLSESSKLDIISSDNPHAFRLAKETIGEETVQGTVRFEGGERTESELESLEPTFLQHEAITKQPFAASYFKLDKVYPGMEMNDQASLKRIDEYIKSKITSGTYEDSAKSAVAIIKNIEKTLGLKPYHDPYYRMDRLNTYLMALSDFTKFNDTKRQLIEEIKNAR